MFMSVLKPEPHPPLHYLERDVNPVNCKVTEVIHQRQTEPGGLWGAHKSKLLMTLKNVLVVLKRTGVFSPQFNLKVLH